jgi:hypothetical protein
MSDNKLLVTFARGTAASLAVGCLVPNNQPAINDAIPAIEFASLAEQPVLAPMLADSSSTGPASFTVKDFPKAWSNALDKEFRLLALEEARGEISEKGAARLKLLDAWRERLVEPRTADEISLQLKRDRILEQFSKTFEDYVRFKEGARRQRSAPA